MNKIIEDQSWRYACKKFDATKKVPQEDLEVIVDSLVLTASSYGMQPWEFVVVKSDELKEKLVSASYNQNQVHEASAVIVLCIKNNIDETLVDSYLADIAKTRGVELSSMEGFKKMLMGVANKEESKKKAWAKNQVYIALGNLLNTCASLRVDTCPMEGIIPSKYNEILDLSSKGISAVLACPIGYRSEEDKYSSLEKVRFAKEDIVTYML